MWLLTFTKDSDYIEINYYFVKLAFLVRIVLLKLYLFAMLDINICGIENSNFWVVPMSSIYSKIIRKFELSNLLLSVLVAHNCNILSQFKMRGSPIFPVQFLFNMQDLCLQIFKKSKRIFSNQTTKYCNNMPIYIW